MRACIASYIQAAFASCEASWAWGESNVEKYICIHAHFYQPPRENPWLEIIEYQPSAHPYHDWNERIAAECYAPNGMARILDGNGRIDQIVNNYSGISFNFGPTLLSWLAGKDPATYGRILEADKESCIRFSGHGSAIAQAYNHPILPLCNHRDKITQIRWGISDFSHRFGRPPESMWIPETAADLETLDLMAGMGLKFAILAPHQAKRVRHRGERAWHTIAGQSIDPSMAYEISLPSGRKMALFFYDGPISRGVGFEKLLSDGAAFVNRLMSAFSSERKWPQIVHIATDGETFGHHHPFGDMALAYALHSIESGSNSRLTNYAEYLEKYPPSQLVEIWENSSWSCPHGIARWREDCGCNAGGHPDWHQQWRTPLRESLDWLRDHLESFYHDAAVSFVKDPWAARNDYIDVILDRSPESVESFLAKHKTRELNSGERVKILKLLELQRHAMLMYTSCGWFFDDISNIETIQLLQYAGRAIQLGEDLFGRDNIESGFLEILQNARSNDPKLGNGRDLYIKNVKPAMIDQQKIVGHYAVSSLFQDYPERAELYSCYVDQEFAKTIARGKSKLAVGRCRTTSKVTWETSNMEYAVVHLGDHKISGGVKECSGDRSGQETINEIIGAFEKDDLPSVMRIIDAYFGQSTFSLNSLFKDEQRRVLDIILKAANSDLEELNLQAYERTAPLMRFLMNLGLAVPPPFRNIATAVINSQLLHDLQSDELNVSHVENLFEAAAFWQVNLDKQGLEYAFRETIEKLAQKARSNPGDIPSLLNLATAVRMTSKLPFTINLYRTQNIYYELLRDEYPVIKTAAASGDKNAQTWTEEFRKLGAKISVKVD
jgi:alpha-amylase/alpha-mannosidase (GH57 family)